MKIKIPRRSDDMQRKSKNPQKLMFSIILGIALTTMIRLADANTETIPEKAAIAAWAINEIINSGIDPQAVKKVVDTTFPCKIVYQRTDGEVLVLEVKTSESWTRCKEIIDTNRSFETGGNEKNFVLPAILVVLNLALLSLIFYRENMRRKNRK